MHGVSEKTEVRSCVKVEVDVLLSPSLIVRTVCVDVKLNISRRRTINQSITIYFNVCSQQDDIRPTEERKSEKSYYDSS